MSGTDFTASTWPFVGGFGLGSVEVKSGSNANVNAKQTGKH